MKLSKNDRVFLMLAFGEFLASRPKLLTKEQSLESIGYVNWAMKGALSDSMEGKRVSSSFPTILQVMRALKEGEALEVEE